MEQIFDEYHSFANANTNSNVRTAASLFVYEDQDNILIAIGDIQYFAAGPEGKALRRENFSTVPPPDTIAMSIKYPADKSSQSLASFSIVNEIREIVVNVEFPKGNHVQIPVTEINTALHGTGKSVINPGKQATYTIYHTFTYVERPR